MWTKGEVQKQEIFKTRFLIKTCAFKNTSDEKYEDSEHNSTEQNNCSRSSPGLNTLWLVRFKPSRGEERMV